MEGSVHALEWRMGTKAKSELVESYRRLIAGYLRAVMLETGWKQVEMGAKAGVRHTTIGRALKRENTMEFTALLALEQASGLHIPDALRDAAIAAKQPTRPDLQTELRQIRAEIERQTPEFKQALLEELRRAVNEK